MNWPLKTVEETQVVYRTLQRRFFMDLVQHRQTDILKGMDLHKLDDQVLSPYAWSRFVSEL
jgi:hypothetical protein